MTRLVLLFSVGALAACPMQCLEVADARQEIVIVHFGDSTCITSYLPESQRVETMLNDRLSSFYKYEKIVSHNVGLKGHIGLQIHPGKELLIRFKDIEVRELK